MEQNEMLDALLSDPQKLQSAIAMASSLLAGSSPAPPAASAPPVTPTPSTPPAPQPSAAYDPTADLLGKAMPFLAQIMQTSQQAITPEKKALLQAVKPFLSETAGSQIDHGMRLVMLASIASSVMDQFGRKDNENV